MGPRTIREAFRLPTDVALIETYASWGGVPRYRELAVEERGAPRSRVENLVLDPLGPLHREPDRLLIEELPPALEVRPVLDAIGAGAHRVSEIAGRVGRPSTSMARPLKRLIGMGLVRRETPFGDPARRSRRSRYKIDDPFFRLWFRVVAPHRGNLASGSRRWRAELLRKHWDRLVAEAWEDLCQKELPNIDPASTLGKLGPWGAAGRWWRGTMPDWDVVSASIDGKRLLLGEVKWSARPVSQTALARASRGLLSKPPPELPGRYARREVSRALFVPELAAGARRRAEGVFVVTVAELF